MRNAFINSMGIELNCIPKGTFFMGSPDTEKTRRFNENLVECVIQKPFYISAAPITQYQYSMLCGINPSHFCSTGKGSLAVPDVDTGSFPVENVSWFEATAFCERLSQCKKELAASRTYRLPREDEWEYACRAGSTTAFAFGDQFCSLDGNIMGLYPYHSPTIGPTLSRTTFVKSYKPNKFGLYDMHGNVWEWCDGAYSHVYHKEPFFKDTKVLRGGSWSCYSRFCRSAYRHPSEPGIHYYDYGFRVVCEIRN